MSNAGIPLRVIPEISGHRNLEQLQRYLEVSDAQVLGAAAALSMLSPLVDVGKYGISAIMVVWCGNSSDRTQNIFSFLNFQHIRDRPLGKSL